MDHTHKKRHRIPTSCSVCRKRKSKCDRVKPVCGSCKKKSIAHLCYYETENKVSGNIGENGEGGIITDVGDDVGGGAMRDYMQQPVVYHDEQAPMLNLHQPATEIPDIEGTYRHLNVGDGDTVFPQHGSMYDSNIYQYPLSDMPPVFSGEVPDESSSMNRIPEEKSFLNAYPASITYSSSVTPSAPSSNTAETNAGAGRTINTSDLVSIFVGLNSTLNINPNDTIEYYSNADSQLSNQGGMLQISGALSYVGLSKSDQYMLILRKYVYSLYKSGELDRFLNSETDGLDESATSKTSSDNKIKAKSNDIDMDVDSSEARNRGDYSSIKVAQSDSAEYRANFMGSNIFDFTLLLESLKSTDIREARFKVAGDAILKILPNKLICSRLVGLYYKFIHPFIPIIIESLFMSRLSDMFSKEFYQYSTDYYQDIKIRSDDDLYNAGILILVLQLGQMSLIHTDDSMVLRDETETYILNSKTIFDDLTVDKFVQLCVQDLMAARSSLHLVQFLALLNFYKSVHPMKSDGIGGTDNRNLTGLTMQHALSIGLNRDPTLFSSQPHIKKNEILVTTRRVLWHYLIVSDSFSSMNAGLPNQFTELVITDTLLPPNNVNFATKHYLDTIQIVSASYRNILAKLNNVQIRPRVIDILSETKRLEATFYDFFGKEFFKDYICRPAHEQFDSSQSSEDNIHHEQVMKAKKYLLFIHLRTSLTCIYFIIAMYYENNPNTSSMDAGITLFKICLKSVIQLVYIMSYTLENSVFSFGKNFDCVITASTEKCIAKIHGLYSSYFVRMLHNRFVLTTEKADQDRLDSMDRLFLMILIKSDFFVGSLTTLSKRYASAYKLCIIAFFVLSRWMEGSDSFFLELSNHSQTDLSSNMIQYCNIDEMNYISKLIQEFKNAKVAQNKSIREYMTNRVSTGSTNTTTNGAPSEENQKRDTFEENFDEGFFFNDGEDIFTACKDLLEKPLISKEELYLFFEEIGNINLS